MDSKQIPQKKDEELTNLTNEVLGGTGESFLCFVCGQHSRKIGRDGPVIRKKAYFPKSSQDPETNAEEIKQ